MTTRIPHVTERFRLARNRLVREPGDLAEALRRTVARLVLADTLPTHEDVEAALPPVQTAWARQVPGRPLWLWYQIKPDGHLVLVTLTTAPPVEPFR